ncbi:hypothetical protein [Ferrovibrio sp.]|uniref:hypothetical protein n=1 Tax=Ferrovibrio sp. TaxID=1917215 RepID=UPI00311FE2E1
MSQPVWIRSKEVCFLEADWWDFGMALQEMFPQARYYREPDPINRPEDRAQTPEPPVITLHDHLLDTRPRPMGTVMMVFDPDWQPSFRKISTEIGREPEDWRWGLTGEPPLPYVAFGLGGHVFEQPVPHPYKGAIHFYTEPHNGEQAAMMGRFFRLFGKFATNRKGLVRVRVPELTVTAPVGKGQPDWCGHHALEWARQNPSRVLFYERAGFGIRPTGEVLPLAKAAAGKKSRRAGG